MSDKVDLVRFVAAQQDSWPRALGELRAGSKKSHWMWYVFPQIAGLGMSDMSRRYALSGRAEAQAYVAHPILGERLREGVGAMAAQPAGTEAAAVLGHVDAQKFRSCLTLFAAVSPDPVFAEALARFYDSVPCERTLEALALDQSNPGR